MKVSKALLKELHRRGINRVFGVPGRENAAILFNEVPEIEFITSRVEFNAGIMAEFSGRRTRAPQAAFCTMGPGATNMATAAASAMLNRSPVLFISAQLESDDRYYNITHQCVDQQKVFEPITKCSVELEDPKDLRSTVDHLFKVMMTEPLGPAHLSIPTDFFCAEIAVNPKNDDDGEDDDIEKPVSSDVIWPTPPVRSDVITEARAMMANAKRPLCLVGHEAIRAEAGPYVKELVEAWNIPLITAANAKGILPWGHPLNLGTASPYMEGIIEHPTALKEIFDDVDLLINIGYQYVDDILPKMWLRGCPKRVIHVSSFSASDIKSKYQTDLEAIGHVSETILSLFDDAVEPKPSWPMTRLFSQYEKLYERRSDNAKMSPIEVIGVVNRNLHDGAVISDIGYYRHHVTLFSRPTTTDQFYTDSGISSFGSGLPGAIAAQLLDRDKPVFLVCGDGGFHSGSCDLETLARHQLPVVVIVLNNASFGLIERYQEKGGNGNNQDILHFTNIDFPMLARANGVHGAYATTVEELEHIIEQRDKSKPLLVEVPLDYGESDDFRESF